ncbi:MAG TPA: hypothetical protein VGI76_02145 [Solirubrobacteraceae bacterium]|jgi:hypothetical protein
MAFAFPTQSALAAFGISHWEAGTCKQSSCNVEGKDPEAEFYTQAAGHPNFGITNFAFNAHSAGLAEEPDGHVRDARVDLPSGLAVNPEAVPGCSEEAIQKLSCPPASQVGEDEAIGTAELALGIKSTVTESFPVFNVEHRPGEPARFGVEVKSATLALAESVTGHHLQSVIYLEGSISWHHELQTSESSGAPSGDYHEFFKIQEIPQEPELIKSKLIFWGVPHEHNAAAPDNAFITMPSSRDVCSRPQTTWLHVDSYESAGSFIADPTETRLENGTPLTATGCGALSFDPSLNVKAANIQPDQPDGASIDLHIPQTTTEPAKPNSPDVQNAEVTLPEGMTLDPSAAHGLQACTTAQIWLGSNHPVECPAASTLGTVSVNAPGIPNGTLNGSVFLGTQESLDPESGREYRIFIAAEASDYGVGVRLEGHVKANRTTGRLTAIFTDDPQVPFEDFLITLNPGPRAPLANPLSCGPATPAANITPYSSASPTAAEVTGFTVASGSATAPCPSPPPFSLSQSTVDKTTAAGAQTSFTLNLARSDGQQYLAQLRTVLPAGLLGTIRSVPLCPEPQASTGTCPASSEVGQANVTAGAGPEPYPFTGRVYLTGPYGGYPYGLSVVTPAAAGPFNLGNVVTRAGIGVEMYSGRVFVTSGLPTIEGGVPLRLKTLSVTVNRSNFMFNPTSCAPLSTDSALRSTLGTQQSLSTPLQVGECGKLPFKPSFSAYTGAKTSRLNGASFEVTIVQGAHEANIREVQLQLPKQLPSRLSTLQKACPAATFEVASPPGACPDTSRVGTATVSTPVLPDKLTGPAYLVSHGGQAFPDLDLILRGDGVEVVLVGHTHISSTGITTSTFESLPDVPISGVAVSLPAGPLSVLSANGDLCRTPLQAPTTIVAQSGAKITRNTAIAVRGCPFAILSHRVKGKQVKVKLRVPGAGRVTLSGRYLKMKNRRIARSRTITIITRLTHTGGRLLLRHHHRLSVTLHAIYTPRAGHFHERASATLKFRRR